MECVPWEIRAIHNREPFQIGAAVSMQGMEDNQPTDIVRSDSPQKFPALPHKFGRYVLQAEIGAGGMGRVFKALHATLKQVVALKTIRSEKFPDDDESAVRRFYREIEAAGAVLHPHVARATDAGEERGIHFLITEYIDGINLQSLTQKFGPLSVGVACELLHQACSGLGAIDAQKMVHRDLKPSNILVTWQGQVKIVDLGLARFVNDSSSSHDLTGSHAFLGTVDFLAPEQAMSAREIDIRADIYSLGCTLVWLLTGKPVFGPPNYFSPAQKLRAHAEAEPDWAEFHRLDPRLVPFVKRLLAKDPQDRFQSPAQLAQALEPFRDALGLQTLLEEAGKDSFLDPDSRAVTETLSFKYDTTKPGQETKFWKRVRLSVGIAAGLLLALAIGFWLPRFLGNRPEIDLPNTLAATTVPEKPRPAVVSKIPHENPSRNLDNLLSGQWHNLLERPPKKLYWDSSNTGTEWHYNPKTWQVTGSCGVMGLLELGTTSASDYTFQLSLNQQDLSSGLGLYLGAHPDKHEGQAVIRYQHFQIKAGRIGHKKTYRVTRSLGLLSDPPDPKFFVLRSEHVAVWAIFHPSGLGSMSGSQSGEEPRPARKN